MGNLFDGIHWPAVLVSAVAYFALGALWYSKILFATKWIAYAKIDVNDPNAKKGMAMMFIGSLVLMMISSFAIAVLANRLGLSGWMSGLKLGAFVGACFGVVGIGINYLYEKKPAGLLLINGLYQLLGCIICGIIICMWH
jgi:hypothetical protein